MSVKWFSKNTPKELIPNNKSAFARIFDSMRFRNFRLYFIGQCISQTGTWMQQIAMSWLVYTLTDSIVLLGTVVFLSQIPILFVTPFSSVFTDRYDKRKILLLTQFLAMLQAAVLAVLVFTNTITTGAIMALSFFLGCVNSLDMPTRQAFYPSLVPQKKLSNAIALNSAIINGSRLIGPAIGGVFVQMIGEGGCFLLNAISYLFVLWALILIKYKPKKSDHEHKQVLHELREGFLYVKNSIPIRAILILITVFSFCGFNVTTFLPAYVKDTLNGSSGLLGLIMGCFGVGAFGAAMFLAARKSVLGLGKVVVLTISLSSLCLIPIFLIKTIVPVIFVAMLLGFGLICSIAAMNTLLQSLSHQQMRGRVMGYYSMAFVGFSALGNLFWSWIGKIIGLSYTMIACGGMLALSAFLFEKFRPIIRKHAQQIYIEKGIIKEIAIGIGSTKN